MKYVKYTMFCVFAFLSCSPTSNEEKQNEPIIRSSDVTKPPADLNLILQSTGNPSSRLSKRMLDTFSYPIKEWFPSAFYTGCPDYVKLTITTITAYGNWRTINTHTDTVMYVDIDTTTGDSGRYWDTLIVKSDTLYQKEYRTLWEGSKEIAFDGSSASLSDFDTLHIPEGTIYTLSVAVSPIAKIKGSVTGNFTFGKIGDSTITAVKTYYTKSAYYLDVQTNSGGSADPSVFETGPAEETSINITRYDTGNNQDQFLRLVSACTTSINDSATLTILFDISRVLSFFDADTLNKNQAPRACPYDKAYFYAHDVFAGENDASIALVLPGTIGLIEGYSSEFVWNQIDPAEDIDSLSPALYNDTTFGGRGWLTIIYDANDNVIGGKAFQDNASFSPVGSPSYDATAKLLTIGLNTGAQIARIYDFTRQTTVGGVCYCRVFTPAWTSGDVSSKARSGEIKYTLELQQQ